MILDLGMSLQIDIIMLKDCVTYTKLLLLTHGIETLSRHPTLGFYLQSDIYIF